MASRATNCLTKADPRFLEDVHFCEMYFKAAVLFLDGVKTTGETRYNSWNQCYDYFRASSAATLTAKKDEAALRLAFYLASWGMYRGSSFVLQYDYKIYEDLIPQLLAPKYAALWDIDAEIDEVTPTTLNVFLNKTSTLLMELFNEINDHLKPSKKRTATKSYFTKGNAVPDVSTTLITKLVLGTLGCFPALDQYFCNAIGACGNGLKQDQIKVILRLAYYIKKNVTLPAEVSSYPVMKLIDMYYFTMGLEKAFLKLVADLIDGKSIKSLEGKDARLLRDFILDNGHGGYTVNVAFPCHSCTVSCSDCIIRKKTEYTDEYTDKIKEICNNKAAIQEKLKKGKNTEDGAEI